MRDFALNDKQIEIFRATWPNIGWAARDYKKQQEQLNDKIKRDSPHTKNALSEDSSA